MSMRAVTRFASLLAVFVCSAAAVAACGTQAAIDGTADAAAEASDFGGPVGAQCSTEIACRAGSECATFANGISVCAVRCDATSPCPRGFACVEGRSGEFRANYCVESPDSSGAFDAAADAALADGARGDATQDGTTEGSVDAAKDGSLVTGTVDDSGADSDAGAIADGSADADAGSVPDCGSVVRLTQSSDDALYGLPSVGRYFEQSALPFDANVFGVAPAQLSLGSGFGCSRSATGDVACAGYNYSWNLGRGDTSVNGTPAVTTSFTPQTILTGATNLSSANSQSCAIALGRVWCWGTIIGEVGAYTTPMSTRCNGGGTCLQVPAQLTSAETFEEVSCGPWFCCARSAAKEAWCWGRLTQFLHPAGPSGLMSTGFSLGDGIRNATGFPVKAAGLSDVAQIDVSVGSMCARTSTGAV